MSLITMQQLGQAKICLENHLLFLTGNSDLIIEQTMMIKVDQKLDQKDSK